MVKKSNDIETENIETSVSENDAAVSGGTASAAKKKAAGKKTGLSFRSKSDKETSVINEEYVENVNDGDIAQYKTSKVDSGILHKDRFKKKKKVYLETDLSKAERIEAEYNAGLTEEQVEKRNEEGFVNRTAKKVGKTYGSIFFSNICTFFNLLIFIVAAALILVGADITQLFFLIIIVLNITIGIVLEIKSKITVERLNLITAPSAVVVREGEKTTIPINEVVLDDILYVETGKQICTDSIVVKGECEVNESMLTGESHAVKKSVGDMLYSGSFVSSGACYARAEKVGASNYVETLSSHVKKYKKPNSELYKSIQRLVQIISIFIVPLAAILVLTSYNDITGSHPELSLITVWNQVVSTAAGSVIGMIPAGMFLLVSSALGVSAIRLAKKKTSVKDLYCIEMLAREDVLCLDKTGTITDGSMEVKNVVLLKNMQLEHSLNDIIGSMLTATEDNNQTALALAGEFGYSTKLKPETVIPFSSQRKLSAVTFEDEGTYILGAPEYVLKEMGVKMEKYITQSQTNGLRMLVLAYSPNPISKDKIPANRKAVCMISIEDHIRADAIETIKWFKDNNVHVKVISGDNPITVSEVAKRVGVDKADLYISLDGLSNQEVIEAAHKYTVFGRVTPEQKMLLVKALKAKGHTVAMTGDGVNDILAMREADCAISIASGAEAARNVSHLVLLNSDFTSLPDVVKEGRRVVNNIQNSSSLFLMKTMMSIILTIIFLLMRKSYPLRTDNLLLLELFVIGIPSFFLAMQSNTNIIKGSFFSNVLSRSLPGAIALVTNVMMLYIFKNVWFPDALSNDVLTSLLVFTLTLTGWIVLVKICEPFNLYRGLLCVGSLIAIVVSFIALPSFFGIVSGLMNLSITQNLINFLFVTTLILTSYFTVSIIMKLFKNLKIMM